MTDRLPARLRAGLDRRAVGFLLALLVEALLVILMFTLGVGRAPVVKPPGAMTSVDFKAPSEDKAEVPKPDKADPERPQFRQPDQAVPNPPVLTPPPTTSTPPFILLSRKDMAALDISKLPPGPPAPPAPSKSQYGPVNSGSPSDSKLVGTAPNGEPLYAAAWYREPYDDELKGYLSTADGPGWGLIACRTVPEYRVEDCVALDEYPSGSRIARAVLAAAWQFRVRPPRLGGRPKIGEWVRIRIDYGIEARTRGR